MGALTAEESFINKEIEKFFLDKPRNSKGISWFSSKCKHLLPDELKEHYLSIRKFFRKKSWHCGGPIPEELLYTQSNFHLLQNISLPEATDLAYEWMEEC